jgi:hypothetical protein
MRAVQVLVFAIRQSLPGHASLPITPLLVSRINVARPLVDLIEYALLWSRTHISYPYSAGRVVFRALRIQALI